MIRACRFCGGKLMDTGDRTPSGQRIGICIACMERQPMEEAKKRTMWDMVFITYTQSPLYLPVSCSELDVIRAFRPI